MQDMIQDIGQGVRHLCSTASTRSRPSQVKVQRASLSSDNSSGFTAGRPLHVKCASWASSLRPAKTCTEQSTSTHAPLKLGAPYRLQSGTPGRGLMPGPSMQVSSSKALFLSSWVGAD